MTRAIFNAGLVAAVCLLSAAGGASAQTLSATTAATPPPDEVAAPIKALLGPGATVVTRGANTIELWWRKALPLESAPSGNKPAWSSVADGAVIGVMRTSKPLNDIRGFPMKPGVYVLRFALQPQDGDHMGVSPNREFLLVGPAAEDQSADPAGFKGAVALARKTQGRSHPAALSIDPTSTSVAPGSVVTTETDFKSVVVNVPATSNGAAAGSLTFGLVLVGQVDH
jgi:hypothetical protein